MHPRLEAAIAAVRPADDSLRAPGQAHLDNLTKPRGSLGRLEEIALDMYMVRGEAPRADPMRIYTIAGDHGVVAEGVSLFPQEVTRQMVLNFLRGGAGINALCTATGIQLKVVDAGSCGGGYPEHPDLFQRKVAPGTANFAHGPAMSEEQCLAALHLGLDLAEDCARDGIRAVGTGDMGIGNTTPSTALYCAFLGFSPAQVTGPGTGLDAAAMARKAEVIGRALDVNRTALDKGPLAVLAALGGYEIAALAGLILGCAGKGITVAVDGFISTAAYVAARALCPTVSAHCLLSHASAEPGHRNICEALGERPLFDLGMRLGEGTGAAIALHVVRCACAMWNDMASFADAGVSPGTA